MYNPKFYLHIETGRANHTLKNIGTLPELTKKQANVVVSMFALVENLGAPSNALGITTGQLLDHCSRACDRQALTNFFQKCVCEPHILSKIRNANHV